MLELRQIQKIKDIKERYRELLELHSELLSKEDVRVLPYRDRELPNFSNFSVENQIKTEIDLNRILEVYTEMRSEGISLRDSPKLLWRVMRRMSLTPQSDIFDKIADDDVVEIYNTEQNQIFRNIKFFEYISYSLEEVYGVNWQDATARPEKNARELYALCVDMFSGKIPGTVSMKDVQSHVCEETKSVERFRIHLSFKWLSPIKSEQNVIGLLVVHQCQLV